VHALIATGVNAGGTREIPGSGVPSAGDGAGRLASFRGPAAAIAPALPGATWRRCRTRYLRDLPATVNKASQPRAAALARAISGQPGPAGARAQPGRAGSQVPAAAEHPAAARAGLPAFTAVPRGIGPQVRPSRPRERLNRDLRRRAGVAGTFPGPAAIIGPAGAVLTEQNGGRAGARRYTGTEVPARTGAALAAAGTPGEVNAIKAISA